MSNWHYREIDENRDYGFALIETFDVKRCHLLNTCQVVILIVVPPLTLNTPSVLALLVDMVILKCLVKIKAICIVRVELCVTYSIHKYTVLL